MEPMKLSFGVLMAYLNRAILLLPDPRKASNATRYTPKDAVLGAFSVFFMQSESFLEHQRQMESHHGKSNAQSLFGMINLPTVPQIRNIIDGIPATALAKYKNNLEGNSNFPEEGIESLVNAIQYLFNPAARLEYINKRLLAKVEEARSLVRDGYIPQVRALACNNGLKWNASAQEATERTGFGDQVTWEHFNHERLVKILQASRPVKDTLQLSGKAIVEDMEFSRVLVGRVSVSEIAALIERHGERLLERNIRRYLGLQRNRVNEGIRHTLTSDEKNNFYFYNNGVTLTCDSFSYNALQNGDYQVRVENLQIINGGQTCRFCSLCFMLYRNADGTKTFS
jgi:AIPR protein